MASKIARAAAIMTMVALAISPSARADSTLTTSPYNTGITGYPPPPLVAGQSEVLLTDSEDLQSVNTAGLNGEAWDPISGVPLTVTLWWRPLLRPSAALNAYVAFQPLTRACAGSPAGDHEKLLTGSHVILMASGDYANGDYRQGVYNFQFDKQITLNAAAYVQACIWIARSQRETVLPSSQVIPLLNDTAGIVVNSFLNPGWATADTVSLTATYGLTVTYPGQPSEQLLNSGFDDSDCGPVTFRFSAPDVYSTLDWNCQLADMQVSPIEHAGGCIMGRYIVGLTVAEALYWIDEQGCRVDYLEPNTEFGDVQATVDGGGVVIAPYGSHVDLSVPDDTVPSARPPGKVPYSTAVPAPPGADCSDATSFTHESLSGEEKQKFKIGSLSSDDLPFAVTVSASLGSIGVCKRGAIADIDAKLDLTPPPPQLKLGASDDSGKQTTAHVARYSFAPLGWHVSPGDGAQTFGSPTVEWSNSSSIEVSPALDLTANGKSPPDITLDLISVPVSPATAIVVDHGQPYLSATLGPTFSFGLTLNRKELQKLVEQAVALGLDASAAIAYVTVELGDEVGDALITFAPKIGPPGPLSPQGYEPDTQNLVAEIESETEAEYAQDIAELDGGVDAAETEEVIDNIIQFPGAAIEDVVDDAGESLVEVGPEALVAARDRAHLMLRIPPNPRLVPSKGKVTQASTLPVTPLQKLNPHEFVRAPLPSAQIAPTVRALLGLPVMASVGGLAVTTPRLQPGGKLSVVAPGLSSEATGADLVLAGPGYHATRLLQVRSGATGVTIELPRKLAAGRWTVAVEDLSGVTTGSNGTPSGEARIRMGIFTVR